MSGEEAAVGAAVGAKKLRCFFSCAERLPLRAVRAQAVVYSTVHVRACTCIWALAGELIGVHGFSLLRGCRHEMQHKDFCNRKLFPVCCIQLTVACFFFPCLFLYFCFGFFFFLN